MIRMRHLLLLLAFFASFSTYCADTFVSSSGSDTTGDGSSGNPYATIGKGVATANAGDTINIAFGTYVEQLTLTKNLTIIGNGAGTTVIRCPGALTNNVPNNTTPAAPGNAIVAILGATVTMSNIAVSGPGWTNCGTIQYGIFVGNGGTLNLNACRVSDIRDEPVTGCQNGRAVAAGATALGQAGTVVASGCEILNYQKSGLSVEGTNSSLTAANCTITGLGPTAALAQNGILIADGPMATIGNCTITNNFFTPGPTASCGLLNIGDASRISVGSLSFSGNNANIVGLPITITSLPFATPNPARPGQEVTLITAGQASSGGLTYTWNFGDGTTLGGATVKHTWTAAGLYRAEVEMRTVLGNSVKAFIDVTVEEPPPLPEVLLPLNVAKKSARAKNPSKEKDSFQARGTFDLPNGVTTLDGPLQFRIGSAIVDFTMDAKGKSAKDPKKNSFRIKGKYKKKVLTTQTVQFQVKMLGNFLKVLEELGLAPGTAGTVKIKVPFRMLYKGQTYGQDLEILFKSTAKGASGK